MHRLFYVGGLPTIPMPTNCPEHLTKRRIAMRPPEGNGRTPLFSHGTTGQGRALMNINYGSGWPTFKQTA
jgi:hypothetical protein